MSTLKNFPSIQPVFKNGAKKKPQQNNKGFYIPFKCFFYILITKSNTLHILFNNKEHRLNLYLVLHLLKNVGSEYACLNV